MKTFVLTERDRQLIRMLGEEPVCSGNDLAQRLGISRAGVWKAVRRLQSLGMEIHAVPGAGYRMAHRIELLDAEAIQRGLTAQAAARLGGVHLHDAVASTNTCLRHAARAGASSGTLCLAEMQTSGRGRLGRRWQSPLAGNVYLSLLWHFSSPALLEGLSLAVGALLVRVLRAAGAHGAALKWPNDIQWNERKLGGILIEMSGEIHGQCAVIVGIGLNCYLPNSSMADIGQPAVALHQIPATRALSRDRLVADLLNALLPALAHYETEGLAAYLEEWHRYHAFAGRAVRLERGDEVIEGTVVGITASGLLLLDGADGVRREFSSGDIRLRAATR